MTTGVRQIAADLPRSSGSGHYGSRNVAQSPALSHNADMTYGALVPDFLGLVEAKFQTNERGQLVGSGPHFYLLRTPGEAICRFHADLAYDVVLRLEALSQRERGRPAQWQSEYGDYLTGLAAPNLRVAAMRAGPLYIFPDDIAPSGACTAINESNLYLLHNGLEEWLPDASIGHPFFATIEDDRAVAVCTTVIASQGAHEAGVETLAAYRGRGLAADAVAAWAYAVRKLGAVPLYATTFDNISSQRVAQRLSLSPAASEFSVYCRLIP
jgi:GNAT superfamily N-acetyltransferase